MTTFHNLWRFDNINNVLLNYQDVINKGFITSEKSIDILGHRLVNDGEITGEYIFLPNLLEIEGNGTFNAKTIFIDEAIKDYFVDYDNIVVLPDSDHDWNYMSCEAYLVSEGYLENIDM